MKEHREKERKTDHKILEIESSKAWEVIGKDK
jgi:hypothetical protein